MNFKKIDSFGSGGALGPCIVAGANNYVGTRDPGSIWKLPQGSNKHIQVAKAIMDESVAEAVVAPPYIYWCGESKGKLIRQDGFKFTTIHNGYKGGGWSLGMSRSEEGEVLNVVKYDKKSVIRDKFGRELTSMPGVTLWGIADAGSLGWFVWGHGSTHLPSKTPDKSVMQATVWLLNDELTVTNEYRLSKGYAWRGAWISRPGWQGMGQFVVGTRDDARLWAFEADFEDVISQNPPSFKEKHRFDQGAKRIDRIVQWKGWVFYALDNGQLVSSPPDFKQWFEEYRWKGKEVRAIGPRPDDESLLVYVNGKGKHSKSKIECWEGWI